MKKYILLLLSCVAGLCTAQSTSIYYDMDNCSVSSETKFSYDMRTIHGYKAGALKLYLVEKQDTCCLFSSIGDTQFKLTTTELATHCYVYSWPQLDTEEFATPIEDCPREIPENAELTLHFQFYYDSPLVCNVEFNPERWSSIKYSNLDMDSLLNYPHYFVDEIYGIVFNMIAEKKNKAEIENFLDEFNNRLDPSMLESEKGYGYGRSFGYYFGYEYYKYSYNILKALLHVKDYYIGKEIVGFNNELNAYYQELDNHRNEERHNDDF